MYYRLLGIPLLFIIIALLVSAKTSAETPVAVSYADGDGTSGTPYQISTLAELRLLSETEADWAVDTYFILTADIDATDTNTWNEGNHDYDPDTPYVAMGFEPIGEDSTPFLGKFDGQNHVITNLHIDRPQQDYVGLFGYVSGVIGAGATISNIGLEGGSITGEDNVGSLIGTIISLNYQSSVTSCYSTATVTGMNTWVGGLIGSSYADITSCYATGDVSGDGNVGGFIGASSGDEKVISLCYATGSVSGDGDVGGFAGHITSIVENCYATGNVSSVASAGGFAGHIMGFVTSCDASGDVSSEFQAGGFVGGTGGDTITSCSATGNVSASGGPSQWTRFGGFVGAATNGTMISCFATGAVTGHDKTGGFSGNSYNSFFTSCFATGAVTGAAHTGGFTGDNGNDVTSCFATGAVTGTGDNVGGFVGYAGGFGEFNSNYSTGSVTGTGNNVGGFAGHNDYNSYIRNSYSTSTVTGSQNNVGGFVGSYSSFSFRALVACYSTGSVIGFGENIGGFSGLSTRDMYSCYWDTTTSGFLTSGNPIDYQAEIPLTTTQMKSESSYDSEEWDFTTTPDWVIVEGETRPFLAWQTAVLFVGTATTTETSITIDTGYVLNVNGSGITLDEYGVAYREYASNTVTYYDLTTSPLAEAESVSLDNTLIEDLTEGINYWYSAYAVDNNGEIHTSTERLVVTNPTPTISTWPTAAGITYGQTLADATLSGGSASVPGTFAFDAPATIPNVGTAPYAVTFTPDDTDNYNSVFSTVSVTVSKATPVINTDPTASQISYGQTLADSVLSGGTTSVPGTFAFDSPSTAPGPGTASHDVTFTPDDTTNYTTASTSVSVTVIVDSYTGGDGSQGDPYQISSLPELELLSLRESDWVADTYFILTADIDATETNTWNVGDQDNNGGTADEPMGFFPIGNDSTPFLGVIDGQGYVISNLYIKRRGFEHIGLVGYAGAGSSISNVTLQGGSVKGKFYVGSLVGTNYGTITSCYTSASVVGTHTAGGLVGLNNAGTITSSHATQWVYAGQGIIGGLVGTSNAGMIESCYAAGNLTSNSNQIGGLIGLSELDTITSCEASGRASGADEVGGLVGAADDSDIHSSSATGTAIGTGNKVGGLVGFVMQNSTVTACFSTGMVLGDSAVGGLIGSLDGTITSCYSTGLVTAIGSGGGFIGDNLSGTINSCYWDMDTSGQNTSDGGTGLTSAQMLLETSFIGFDFTTTPDWAIIEGDTRPYLPSQAAALFEGTATSAGAGFKLDTGYVHNVTGSGLTLDEYGVAYREDASNTVAFFSLTDGALNETDSVSLDGEIVNGLLANTTYWYRVYAVDSDGKIHYGTERTVTTTESFPVIYVDFSNGSPSGTGTEEDPVDSIAAALALVDENGTIKINSGTTTEIITIDQAVTLERNGESGSVIIGN